MTVEISEDCSVMLNSCRERLVDGVTAVFIQHAGRANQEFMALADRAVNSEQQQIYFGAMHLLANRPQQLLQNFRNVYCVHFDSTIANLCGGRSRRKSALPDELSLVDQDEFELDLALSKLSARASLNCSQQLVALDRRFAAMLKIQRIRQDDNPLHPGHLYRSLLEALAGMDIERPLAFAILESFERQTAVELPGIYAGINRFLSKSGVLPTMSTDSSQDHAKDSGGGGASGPGGGGYAASSLGGAAGPGPMSAYGASSMPAGAQTTGEDLFSQLLRAIQSAAMAAAGQGQGFVPGMPMPPMPPMSGTQMAGAPYQQTFSANQLVEALGNVQRGPVEPGSMPGMGSARLDPQGFNVLQQIRATPMANGANATDAMTIDIVSMLFDAIFNDPDLSSTMRAEIAKLQIPVLKVALLDKSFFSDRRHPARRLLDAIANSGIGRSDQDEPRLVAKITSIVEAVVKGFDSDIQIFATQLQKLEEFLTDEEARAQDKSTEMVDQLATRERKDVAPNRATSEVETRINRRNVPPLVADFLSRQWRLVLVDAFVRGGEAGKDWIEALRLMDELIWSVNPKQGAQDRERLLALLPDMLKRLRTALERVDLAGDWDAFFSELIRLHMAALHKDAQTDPALQGAQSSGKAADWSEARLPATPSPSTPERSEDATTRPRSPGSDSQLELVQSLEVGAWVEFQSFRGTRNTLRLSWVSEFKRVYLFTNRQGENAMTLAATSFAEHLRKGTARLLSPNPLTDRAVAQVLEKVAPPSSGPAGGSRPPGYAWE
ncbi:DUF1631 domain-containing protein [Imhoffiella purpurea]|uniref:Thymidine phosphorylase n=1 Tax=Imhoffiella purpurea TaxID=1249627 RepID=W9V3V8_9GAMM|nr:DUF1631 domain-containing protein [Imhoffiella purpurea]EXJ14009.1 Thymidine phosphorylase [Imhoffiella purpurea]